MKVANFTFRSVKQAQVFTAIATYYAQYGSVPSYRVLCCMFGWKSLNSSVGATRRLEADGLLVRIAPRNGTGGRALLVPVGVKVQPGPSKARHRAEKCANCGAVLPQKRVKQARSSNPATKPAPTTSCGFSPMGQDNESLSP